MGAFECRWLVDGTDGYRLAVTFLSKFVGQSVDLIERGAGHCEHEYASGVPHDGRGPDSLQNGRYSWTEVVYKRWHRGSTSVKVI